MRAVVQRVSGCTVQVEGKCVGSLEKGLLVYLGVAKGDTEADLAYIAEKAVNLRIFPDDEGKMNLSVGSVRGGDFLVISQFTLYGDARKGRRPSYSDAAEPELARRLYAAFLSSLRERGFDPASGEFGASMQVRYCNDGPITILLDSTRLF